MNTFSFFRFSRETNARAVTLYSSSAPTPHRLLEDSRTLKCLCVRLKFTDRTYLWSHDRCYRHAVLPRLFYKLRHALLDIDNPLEPDGEGWEDSETHKQRR